MKKAVAKKPKKLKKSIKSISPTVGLMLEGNVFLIEYDAAGKVISKAPLDNQAVLQALYSVIIQSTKVKKP